MTPSPAGTDAAEAARLDFLARVAAHERFLQGVKTEVLSQEDLAGCWRVGEDKIRSILARIDGAEKVAGGWRVPVYRMPPTYHAVACLLRPAARDAA